MTNSSWWLQWPRCLNWAAILHSGDNAEPVEGRASGDASESVVSVLIGPFSVGGVVDSESML